MVVQDFKRQHEEIELPENTVELEVPEGVTFSAMGSLPSHAHHYTRDSGRTYRTVAMFVPQYRCSRCTKDR